VRISFAADHDSELAWLHRSPRFFFFFFRIPSGASHVFFSSPSVVWSLTDDIVFASSSGIRLSSLERAVVFPPARSGQRMGVSRPRSSLGSGASCGRLSSGLSAAYTRPLGVCIKGALSSAGRGCWRTPHELYPSRFCTSIGVVVCVDLFHISKCPHKSILTCSQLFFLRDGLSWKIFLAPFFPPCS